MKRLYLCILSLLPFFGALSCHAMLLSKKKNKPKQPFSTRFVQQYQVKKNTCPSHLAVNSRGWQPPNLSTRYPQTFFNDVSRYANNFEPLLTGGPKCNSKEKHEKICEAFPQPANGWIGDEKKTVNIFFKGIRDLDKLVPVSEKFGKILKDYKSGSSARSLEKDLKTLERKAERIWLCSSEKMSAIALMFPLEDYERLVAVPKKGMAKLLLRFLKLRKKLEEREKKEYEEKMSPNNWRRSTGILTRSQNRALNYGINLKPRKMTIKLRPRNRSNHLIINLHKSGKNNRNSS